MSSILTDFNQTRSKIDNFFFRSSLSERVLPKTPFG